MPKDRITCYYVEPAENVAARLARGTGDAGADLETYLEDVRSAVHRCADDMHANLCHGGIAYLHMRRDVLEDGSTWFAFHFEVERDALPFTYRAKHITILERDYTHVLHLKSVAIGFSTSFRVSDTRRRCGRRLTTRARVTRE